MYLTTENAADYVGKTLDAKHRACGVYPFAVVRFEDGTYCRKAVKTGICTPVPVKGSLSNAVIFDIVDGAELPAWDGSNWHGFQNPPGVDKEPPEWMEDYQKEDFQHFKLYAVVAESLRDFCRKYHRRDRVLDWDVDYQSHKEELLEKGYTLIPPTCTPLTNWAAYYGEL